MHHRIGFVSTYPPTECGLASFTASLRDAMAQVRGSGDGLAVVRVSDGCDTDGIAVGAEVVADLNPADLRSVTMAAERLSDFDAVILQHEYGIYGPGSGKAVLDLVEQIGAPLITTVHTVLAEPTELQQRILERLVAASARTVMPARGARRQLVSRYRVDPRSVATIPHGTNQAFVDPVDPSIAHRDAGLHDSAPTLLTWGLIGPSKGLESALLAVKQLRHRFPGLRFVIAGRTHPKVVEASGEAYRRFLEGMVERLHLDEAVDFIDDYLPRESLDELVRAAALVVLPYDSTEQVVSGVLVEAVAAAVPVVATAFPHAVELAEEGAVTTVPHRSPNALADAIGDLLDSPEARYRMVEAQRRLASGFEWSSVAARYEQMVRDVAVGRALVKA